MRPLVLMLVALEVAGCAAVPTVRTPDQLFADHLFSPPPEPVDLGHLFAPSEAMRTYLVGPISRYVRDRGPRLGLLRALADDVRLDYDATATRTAAGTFDARAGNCLSLVIMASAFARQLGIPVQYQAVTGQDAWMRSGGIAFRSGHVNLVLGVRADDMIPGRNPASPLVVDFLPPPYASLRSSRVISEETIIGMYGNNRAAEALVDGDTNAAYWWARAAIRNSPAFLPAYNTLAVTYLRHGDLPEAERALRHGLEREPENVEILTNLALALSRQGRDAEAGAVRLQLAKVAPNPPYQFLDEGLAALARGETDEAARLIRKELQRMPYDDEVNLALAIVSLRLGDVRRARKHMNRAVENSPTPERRQIYAAKLRHLDSLPTTR